ncbi:MAG TPA: sigma-70 factor domain-containing protein, partial [Rudaea sp.]|nr:sigma-70 factor domain-containing protein [Rudaea sp.]
MSTALIASNLPMPNAIGSLDSYITAVHQIPVLSLDEEQALARRYNADNDLDAAKHLVLSHL